MLQVCDPMQENKKLMVITEIACQCKSCEIQKKHKGEKVLGI